MDYTTEEKEHFEVIVDAESDHQLEVLTFVEPDVIVVYDGDDSISVSKGKEENQAFFEVYGKTRTIDTSAENRTKAVEKALKQLSRNYTQNLEKDALNF